MQTNTTKSRKTNAERLPIGAIIAAYGPVEHNGQPHPFSGAAEYGWSGPGGTYFAAQINDGLLPKMEVRWQPGPGQQARSRRFYGGDRRALADAYAQALAAGTEQWPA